MISNLGDVMAPSMDGICKELRGRDGWMLVRLTKNGNRGCYGKVPVNARTMRRTDPTAPGSWSAFEAVREAFKKEFRLPLDDGSIGGVGIALAKEMRVAVLDIDDCIGKDKRLDPRAEKLVRRLGGVCEISASGRGVHVWIRAGLPEGAKHKITVDGLSIEAYDSSRYIMVTGHMADPDLEKVAAPETLPEMQAELDALYAEAEAAKSAKKPAGKAGKARSGKAGRAPEARAPEASSPVPAERLCELVRLASTGPEGETFQRLFVDGDISRYKSPSEPDFVICKILAKEGATLDEIDAVVRGSALDRGKWTRPDGVYGTYGRRTAANAIAEVNRLSENLRPLVRAAANSDECGNPKARPGEEPEEDRWVGDEEEAYRGASSGATEGGEEDPSAPGAGGGEEETEPDGQPFDGETSEGVIGRIRKSPYAQKFDGLYVHGRVEKYGGWSAAVLAFCQMIAMFTRDEKVADEIVRASAIYRDEWNAVGDEIIEKAFGSGSPQGGEREKKRGEKPAIYISCDVSENVRRLAEVLVADPDIEIYGRGREVVVLERNSALTSLEMLNGVKDAYSITSLTEYQMLYIASKAARWGIPVTEEDGTLGLKEKTPPMLSIRSFLAEGSRHLPQISRIVKCPQIKKDGTILCKEGYDPETHLYFDLGGETYDVPDKPSRAYALHEARYLLDEFFADYPFADEPSKSTAMGAALTPFVQYTVGKAPLITIDAPMRGSGKSNLVDSISLLAWGRDPAVLPLKSEEENKKAILSVLLTGAPVISIDNVEHNREVSSSSLCTVLTEDRFGDRKLQKTLYVEVPSDSIWLINGNNISLDDDLTRRALKCRLDSKTENPEHRTFKRKDPKGWVLRERTRIITACLTILRAYLKKGAAQGITPLGSFNAWSDVVRGALVWLGFADPVETQKEFRKVNVEREETARFLRALHKYRPRFFASDLTDPGDAMGYELKVMMRRLLTNAECGVNGELTGRAVGGWLRRHKDQVIEGFRLTTDGQARDRSTIWVIHDTNEEMLELPPAKPAELPEPKAGEMAYADWLAIVKRDGSRLKDVPVDMMCDEIREAAKRSGAGYE